MSEPLAPESQDDWLTRYSRHLLMPELDVAGQEKLQQARVLVVGAGGLGSPVALYLAASGVGTVELMDHDHVELSNLQRQIAHGMPELGELKVDSAKRAMQRINPYCTVIASAVRADELTLPERVRLADVVVDCTDRFSVRFAVNRACVAGRKPLVSGAAIRLEGQLAVFDAREPASPCYHCLYPDFSDDGMTCSESGVAAPLVGVIGSLQAMETLRLIAGLGQREFGKLVMWDASRLDIRTLRIPRDPVCATCQHRDAS